MAAGNGHAIENKCQTEAIRSQCSWEENPESVGTFSLSSQSRTRSRDDQFSDQSQYIEMDLAMSIPWEKLVRTRRLQKSLDSQEFEFDMSTGPDLLERVQLPAADELFYKGQLLPLQRDPHFQLVQILRSQGKEASPSEELSQKLFPYSLTADDVRFSSCRLDGTALDGVFLDSCCSSFRSQNSGYWESTEQETGDSSSSRDSNGSSQDSCCSRETETPVNCTTVLDRASEGYISKFGTGSVCRRNPFSLRTIIHDLKKASKVWVDARTKNPHCWSTNLDQCNYNRHMLPLGSQTGVHNSSGYASSRAASFRLQGKSDTGCNKNPEVRSLKDDFTTSEKPKSFRDNPISKHLRRDVPAVDWNSLFTSTSKSADIKKRATSRYHWHTYLKKFNPLYLKISHKSNVSWLSGHPRMDNSGRAPAMNRTVSSSMKSSRERKNFPDSDTVHISKFLPTASCIAIPLSPPRRRGTTANTSKVPSTREELHSAIQGAIAHCKESHAGNVKPGSCCDSSASA